MLIEPDQGEVNVATLVRAEGRPRIFQIEPPNPAGLCMCGCGGTTLVAAKTHTRRGYVAGEHTRFIPGHTPSRELHVPQDRPMRHDSWFAGFADGEGCFYISLSGRRVLFTISLRNDDAAILAACRDAFGGSLQTNKRTASARGDAKPKAIWTLNGRQSLLALVAYFDEFPLRTKKARDYAVWREAVFAFLDVGAYGDKTRYVRVAQCARHIREVRVYA